MQIVNAKRRPARMLIAAVFAVTMAFSTVAAPQPADAYVIGDCKFQGSSPVIKYWFDNVNSSYQSFFNTGQYRWDLSAAAGYFTSGGTSSNHNIDVNDIWSSSNATAYTTGGCGSSGIWTNNQVDITFNTRVMNSRSDERNRLTAIHELGHAYGLDHSGLGCSNPVVMRSASAWALVNCSNGSAPYSNDVSGVNAIY